MSKQNLRVMRIEFEVVTALKDDCFTKTGKLRRNNVMRKGIADLLKFEGHKFIDAAETEDIIKNATIEFEEVEVEGED
jgi:hypothetical protein